MNQEIVKKLRKLRIEKGFSKLDMAEKLNIELSAYIRLESGRVNTWGKYFREICLIFKINPSEYFDDIIVVEKALNIIPPVFVEREREREREITNISLTPILKYLFILLFKFTTFFLILPPN
jgi:transcriptional regulator with XRE-family HTH domain